MFTRAGLLAALLTSSFVEATTNSAGSTTITAFGIPYSTGFAGSVISANACHTTLLVSCTASGLDLLQCGTLGTQPYTLTEGPSSFEIDFSNGIGNIVGGSGNESCTFSGPASAATQAVCVLQGSASLAGAGDGVTTTMTLSGSQLPRNVIPVTVGARALDDGFGSTCSATGAAAASASSVGVAPAMTGVPDVFKVLVPVGAVLAGAVML